MTLFGRKKYGHKEKLLGKGASGHVYLYLKNNEKYAVKVYKGKENYESQLEYRRRTIREYEILSNISHKNVINVIEFVKGRRIKMVMEFCPVNIRQVLNEDNKMVYFKQLIEGVDYLQSMQICHRDIKLDNLMVDIHDQLKIIDFADALQGVHESMGIIGTGAYVAPEIYSQFKYNAYQSDMWSIGIVLYYFTNKKLPWKIAKPHEDELYRYYADNGMSVGNEIDRVISRLLTVDPALRMDIAETRGCIDCIYDNA